MSDPARYMHGSHPEIELLLRFVEDDLREKERRTLERHIGECWTCKVQIQEIRAGIRGFMEFREELLLPAAPIDPRASGVRDKVLRKVREDSRTSPSNARLSFVGAPLFRPAWIAGVLSLFVFGLFLFFSPVQPQLMAGEVLEHVQNSLAVHRAQERARVVRQRVRIRRGASFVDRELVRGRSGIREKAASAEPAWIGKAGAGLMSGPLTWDDPLAADTFVRWRLLQTERQEEVTASQGLLILTVATSDSAQQAIRKTSLVVRRSDWHIVGKRVEPRTGPSVEATEIEYEVRDEPEMAHSPAVAVSAANLPGSSPEPVVPGNPARNPPAADPDDTEIRVRSVLFHLGFGLGTEEIAPAVHREGNRIAVRGVVSSAERRAQLGEVLKAIPNTIDQVAETVTLPPAGKINRIDGVQPSVATRPPQLRQLLIERLGGEKNATAFSNDALVEAGKTLALATWYRELAQRYPRPQADALPAGSREQLNALVSAVEHDLLLNLEKETGRLESIHGEPFGLPLDMGDPAWENRAERLFHLALEHDQLVSLLFAVTSSEAAKPESSKANLDRLEQVDRAMTSILHDSAVR
jgi:hypothetical protein